jgi:tricorn protease
MLPGYFRFPTIYKDTIVFVCKDDLWTVPKVGGIACRLTAGLGEISWPRFSQDGRHLAFVGEEEGQPDIYVIVASGGQPRCLTFLGNHKCRTAEWTAEGQIIY